MYSNYNCMLFLLRLQAGLGFVWSCMGGCLHPKQPGVAAAGLPGVQVPQLVTSCSLLNVHRHLLVALASEPPGRRPWQGLGVLQLSCSLPHKHNVGYRVMHVQLRQVPYYGPPLPCPSCPCSECLRRSKRTTKGWEGIQVLDVLQGWWSYLQYGLPCVLMVCLEVSGTCQRLFQLAGCCWHHPFR